MVMLRHDVDNVEGDDVDAVRSTAIRGLGRPQARGLLASLLAMTKMVDVVTPAGIYLGRAAGYAPDNRRLEQVACRTALGLFFKASGECRLPPAYSAKAYLLSVMNRSVYDQAAQPVIDDLLASGPPRFIGRPVLTYWWSRVPEDQHVTAWLLVFFQRVSFLVFTTPKDSSWRPAQQSVV